MAIDYKPVANNLWTGLFSDPETLRRFSGDGKCLALSIGGLEIKADGKEYVRVSIGEFNPFNKNGLIPRPKPFENSSADQQLQDSSAEEDHEKNQQNTSSAERWRVGQLVDKNYTPFVFLKNGSRGYEPLPKGVTIRENLGEIIEAELASLGEYADCFYVIKNGALLKEPTSPTLLINNGSGPELKTFDFNQPSTFGA